jgi:hypothetical protein
MANRRTRRPAPAPVTASQCLAWRGAVALANGDASRVRVVDERTAYTRNSADVAGPPWPATRKRGSRVI